jgi:secreted trypsin-like serine protease
MGNRQAALGWALALASCALHTGAAHASATGPSIVGGETDGDDPAVVALVAAGGELHCSGVVIAPRAVLTAGHCLGEGGAWRVVADARTLGAAPVADVVRVEVAPDFDSFWLTADLGIAFVDPPLSIAPAALASLPPAVGQPVRVVGYGRSEADLGGVRRAVTGEVQGVAGDRIGFGRGACDGDSGGPLYAGGVVQAVVSASTRTCDDGAAADVAAHRDWIAGALSPGSCNAAPDPSWLVSIAAVCLVALRRGRQPESVEN